MAELHSTSKTRRSTWQMVTELLILLGPTTVLTALFYYFGYMSAKAFYRYFGVSLSALDLPTTSYVIRSAETVPANVRPFVLLPVALIAGFVAHQVLVQQLWRRETRFAHLTSIVLCSVGAAVGVVGLVGLSWMSFDDLWLPMSLITAGVLVEYGIWVASRTSVVPPRVDALIHAGANLRRGLVGAVVLVATFWLLTSLAYSSGTKTAQQYEESLVIQPQGVVYSTHDLHLEGPGVIVTRLGGAEGSFDFRYTGLRQLVHANGRWFLVPVHWRHGEGYATIVLPDDGRDDVRVDLAPPFTP